MAAGKVAADKVAAERAAAERAAAERAAAEKRAADKAAAERAAAEKAAEKAAAEELRRRATALGLLQVLTTANIADDATLKKSIAFCEEHGVTTVSEMVEYGLIDDFVRQFGLRTVPERRLLRSMLQTPRSGLAAQISNRLAATISRIGLSAAENDAAENAHPALEDGLPAAENHAAEKARRALEEDGFALRALTDKSMLQSLEALLKTDHPKWLGRGRDVSKTYGPYDKLKLACAWKVDHPTLRSKYTAGSLKVQQELKQLENRGQDVNYMPWLPVKTARARNFELSQACNEVILLHGVNREKLLALLSTGLNERFSGTGAGTAFGDGVYLAEDAGKTDQYVSADSAYDPSNELHKRLYDETMPHPEDVFYVLVVRAALGFPVRTQHTGKGATSMDNGAPIFPVNYRELSAVPGVSPPIFHHSLIAELGEEIVRYREFVLFHSDYAHIDYVIAYHRYNGNQKLRTTVCPVSV